MRLAVVSPKLVDRRGTEVHITDICSNLSYKGYKIDCISGEFGDVSNNLSSDILRTKIPALDYSESRIVNPIRASMALVHHFIKTKPDLVVSHGGPLTLGATRIASKICGLPTIHTMHWNSYSSEPTINSKILAGMEWGTSKLSDSYLITVSKSDRSLAIGKGLITEDRCFAVHNGIESIERRNKKFGSGRVLMIGAFTEPKNQMSLIKAFSKIDMPTSTLDFVGGGNSLNHEAVVRSLGLGDRVNFYGAQSDVQPFLDRSDVFVLSSDSECFPLTILEAMRSSLPVIASKVGGVHEAVQDGVTGWLLKPDDDDGLANRLKRMMVETNEAITMGLLGRQRFERNFTSDAMLQKTIDVYEHVMDRHKIHVPRFFMG